MNAVENGKLGCVKAIARSGIDLNMRNEAGNTAGIMNAFSFNISRKNMTRGGLLMCFAVLALFLVYKTFLSNQRTPERLFYFENFHFYDFCQN